ncbi:MAG: 16S rRNA (adenine(1518)-N(6)/adenine(1519)-N(6))-dimethyltransferase RsmA [Oligoflexia bacterium]|nr:16S rRNA (adenine(1518)-N(6)/adenine(1519)-N(6))-dimethyltransferase RsmA [Oligoflexia bacterium]
MKVKDKLAELDVRPSKGRGQNFLIAPEVIDSIIEFGSPGGSGTLVEIGPGLGALTTELSKYGLASVVEIEPAFCAELGRKFPGLRIINADARTFDYSSLGKDLVIFGNLPYAFSTEILFQLIAHAPAIQRAVLMLQREFAERVAASPGGRDYGVLSVNAQMSADIGLGPIVKGNSFHPPTSVDSRVIELRFLKRPRFDIPDIEWFKRVVKAAFSQRRRQLHNSLRGSSIVDPDKLDSVLAAAGIDPMRRAETLSIEEFVRLAQELERAKA